MSCLLNILMDSANQKGIDTHSVVKSSIVQLIAQLVIVMGDEDPDTANSVSCISPFCRQTLIHK
jgi:serine/threonine-protein kinase ATR